MFTASDMLSSAVTVKHRATGTRTPVRKKSKLTLAGDQAATLAKRLLLEGTLNAVKWNLAETAILLDMNSHADVYKAIYDLGLEKEYERAKNAGLIKQGRKPGE